MKEPNRERKNEIKFQIQLNEEQKKAKQIIYDNKITILKGKAGTAKSLTASNTALDMLFKKQIEKIIITRPLVTSGEELGFLPGSVKEKTDPYTMSIYDNMYRLYSKDKIDKEITEGHIEVIPLAYMRGRNFSNCCVILDEAQNCTMTQLELILTRMCIGSKIIICGDSGQIDLKDKSKSGFDFVCKHMKDIPGFEIVNMITNHRDPIVEDILKVYNDYR
jgi:phosphate starvation-inducible PhoH-like protein